MSNTDALRIIDAALNRAEEGLRVVEDYVRFALDDPMLTREIKALRHELTAAAATIAPFDRHAARDTVHDVGTSVSTPAERDRSDLAAVCAANLKRAEQSLRSLEEFGKLANADFAGRIESLRYRMYSLEKAIEVGRSSRDRLQDVRLCVLVDGRESVHAFEQLVAPLVEAGIGIIQLREKRLSDGELIARARALVSLTRRQPPAPPGVGTGYRFLTSKPPAEPGAVGGTQRRPLAIINDRADIAAMVDADGVHVGQDDVSVKDARTIVGTGALVGVSTHNIEQARAAVLDGANYLGAGPTFPSRTKSFNNFAGLDYLREVAADVRLPVFAIGGINADNLPEVLAAGVTRVAVGAAVAEARDPHSAARALLGMLNTSKVTDASAPQTRVASDAAKFPAPSP